MSHSIPRNAFRIMFALCLTLCGCQLKPHFEVGYTVAELSRAPVSAKSVTVMPLADKRGERRRDSQGKLFLLYVPLVPWVNVVYNRADEIILETSKKGSGTSSFVSPTIKKIEDPDDVLFRNSFSEAIAQDLKRSKVFADARFAKDGQQGSSSDYILEGAIKHTEYRVTATSYFLGMPGVLFWLFPLPMEKVVGEVTLDLTLKDASGKVVWSGEVHGEETSMRSMYGTSGMIYGRGIAAFTFRIQKGSNKDHANPRSLFWWHFMALHNAMEQVKGEIEKALTAEG